MQETTKRIIAAGVTLALLAVLVYGTYLPYRKSKLYVAAISHSGSATSLQDFLAPFMASLESPGPVGQEETFRNFAQTVSNVVGNVKNADENTRTVLQALGATVDRFALPVVERRSATSQPQTFYALGSTYLRLYDTTKIAAYKTRGRELLERGLELSPDRPQFLYALFEYERLYGTREEARNYGKRILELWPDDLQTKRSLERLDSGLDK